MFKNAFLILLFLSFFAFGEEDKDVEKIKVTGSHIKRIDVEGVSPISVIDQEQLDFSGFSSIGDVLRDNASTSFVSKKYSLEGGGNTSRTSLRGFPRKYTISLLNGRRSIIGSLNLIEKSNLQLIPKSAIERVEILLDGASATYGSHAIGGVINFITKKDVSGFEFEAGMAVPEPEGGSEYYTSGTSGWSQANHSGLLSWSLRTNRPTYSKYRDYSNFEKYPKFWSPSGSPGSYKIGDKWHPMPGCDKAEHSDLHEGMCKFNYSEYAQNIPESYTLSLFSDIDFDISDNMEIGLQGLFYYEKTISMIAPAPDSLSKRDGTLTDTMLSNWRLPVDTELMTYRVVHEKGGKTPKNRRVGNADMLGGDVYLGFESYLADSWSLQGGLSLAGVVEIEKGTGYFSKIDRGNKKGLITLAEEGKWIPTALTPEEKGDISSAYYTQELIEQGFGILSEVIADGELFSFPNGSLNMAVGARASWDYMFKDADEITWDKKEKKSHQWGGGSRSLGKGSQYYGSAFTEFSLPVNNLPVINNVEFILAGSTDYYEYSGFTSNPSLKGLPVSPKLGLKWHPLDFVSFRGTWATGYKAPRHLDLFLTHTVTHPSSRDFVACKTQPESSQCKGNQVEIHVKGNTELKPETSSSYNVGVILQPLDDLSFSVDYFQNEIKDLVRYMGVDEITYLEAEKELEAVGKLGIDVERDDYGEIIKITSPYINQGSFFNQGLNIKLGIESPVFEENKVYFKLDHVLFTSIKEKSYNDYFGYMERKGHFGYPPFKGQYALGFKLKNNSAFELSTRVTGAYNQVTPTPGQETCDKEDCGGLVSVNFKREPVKIAGQKFDFSAHYEFSTTLALPIQIFDSSSDIDGRLILKVENILGSKPPLHMETGNPTAKTIFGLGNPGQGTITDFYFTEGRVWRVNYVQNF